jgi:hypothetical protein
MLGLIQQAVVNFLKKLFGTQEPALPPLSSEPQSSEPQSLEPQSLEPQSSVIDASEPRYNLRERKPVNYVEYSD